MADPTQNNHDKALDLTEAALDALETGDEAKADTLIEQAKKIDPSALKEVVADLEEAERATDSHDHEDLDDEVDEEDEEAAG
ncbi:MAG: hypothetical protein NVSMB18_21980 [Acetobacteraceae bacterium]